MDLSDSKAGTPESGASGSVRDEGAPLRVLIVEDDPLTGKLAQQYAGGLAATVQLVTSAEDAVPIISRHECDIALVDIGLPGLSGAELVQIGNQVAPQVSFVMISSQSDAASIITAMQNGAEDYIVKPLSAEAVQGAIGRALSRPRGPQRAVRRVLAIGAHPDDVEIGIGATLRRHSALGDEVTILTLTGGEQGGNSNQRVLEAHRAAEILGARLIIRGLEDTMVSQGPETINVMMEAIAQAQPQIIYTHTLNDAHQDHRSTHTATLIAARRIPRVYCYQAPSTTIDFRPTRFVHIDEYMQAKLDAIAAHATQGARPYLAPDLMKATARYWGRFAGDGLVEPLEVVRHTNLEQMAPTANDSVNVNVKELVV